ncbi:MAG TPA: hypothetical protein VIW94_01805 [Acidimicrobiia bacterium]
MIPPPRIPAAVEVTPSDDLAGFLFWMDDIGPGWQDVKSELTEAFTGAREAAKSETSMVFIVKNDDLLGRNGPTRAMAAAGLVSAARTAALEGVSKEWTANVVAYDLVVSPTEVLGRAKFVLENGITTGEIIHLGPGHIGKALI